MFLDTPSKKPGIWARNCLKVFGADTMPVGSHGSSKPPEGAKDSGYNSPPKTPQTGNSTDGLAVRAQSATLMNLPDRSPPPTDGHTPPSESRPLALRHCGGQFIGRGPILESGGKTAGRESLRPWSRNMNGVMPEDAFCQPLVLHYNEHYHYPVYIGNEMAFLPSQAQELLDDLHADDPTTGFASN